MTMTGVHGLLLLLLLPLLASVVVSREPNSISDSTRRPQFVYHDESWLITFLRNVTDTFPHLTHIYSIGKSTQGWLTISVCKFLLNFSVCRFTAVQCCVLIFYASSAKATATASTYFICRQITYQERCPCNRLRRNITINSKVFPSLLGVLWDTHSHLLRPCKIDQFNKNQKCVLDFMEAVPSLIPFIMPPSDKSIA